MAARFDEVELDKGPDGDPADALPAGRDTGPRYASRFRRTLALLTDLVQQGIDRGEFRPVDAKETAIAIGSMYEGLITLWVVDPQMVDLDHHGEIAVRLLLNGLLVDPHSLESTDNLRVE